MPGDPGGIARDDDLVAKLEGLGDEQAAESIARLLSGKADELRGRNILALNDALDRLGESTQRSARRLASDILYTKGFWLARGAGRTDALFWYSLSIDVLGDSKDENEDLVARAAFAQARVYETLGESEESLARYEHLSERYNGAQEEALREVAARALRNREYLLDTLSRPYAARVALDLLVARYGTADEVAIRVHVAAALLNRAHALLAVAKRKQAVAMLDELIATYSGDSESEVRALVATALVQRQRALMRMLRLRATWKNARALLKHIGPSPEPEVCDAVKTANGRPDLILVAARCFPVG